MVEKKYEQTFDIHVALKVIKHISSGIYRDIAGALKELVMNSFDSQATEVEVATGFPSFDTITVSDNGRGMTEEMFEIAFKNVGLSMKSIHREWYPASNGRTIIGMFGIGFLSAAHISTDLRIQTFPIDQDYGLDVTLNLQPYFDYMDQLSTVDEFKMGTIGYNRVPRNGHASGTIVTLRNVGKSKQSRFHSVISADGERLIAWPEKGAKEAHPGQSMKRFTERLEGSPDIVSVRKLCGQEQVLWQLGLTCPVEYLDEGPILKEYERIVPEPALKIIRELKDKAKKFKFHLWYDGIQVRKPILLPTPKVRRTYVDELDLDAEVDVKVFPIDIAGKSVNGKEVQATGYLFFQPNRIAPAEIRGLYPRLHGIGIGGNYDKSGLLLQLKAENPIFRVSMSGELYIESGLVDSLNLDRSGFMEVDPEFKFLDDQVFKKLSSGPDSIISEARKTSVKRRRRRTSAKRKAEAQGHLADLEHDLKKAGIPYTPLFPDGALEDMASELGPGQIAYPSVGSPAVVIDHSKGLVFVDEGMEQNEVYAIIAIVDHLLGSTTNPQKARKEFAALLSHVIG